MKKVISLALCIVITISLVRGAALATTYDNGIFKWVIEPTFDYLGAIGSQFRPPAKNMIFPFAEGGEWTTVNGEEVYVGGRFGFMNIFGVARAAVYDWAGPFVLGYARVRVGEYYGFVLADAPDFILTLNSDK